MTSTFYLAFMVALGCMSWNPYAWRMNYIRKWPVTDIRRSQQLSLSAKDDILASLSPITVAQVGDQAYELVAGFAEQIVSLRKQNDTQRYIPVASALMKIQRNMDVLDNVACRTPQLTRLELAILGSTVFISAASPALMSIKLAEVLVPSMAAIAASIGLSAEYVGKVAVSKAKEISALAIQAAAEAEVLLASAERAKAILPLCVGIATTASAFALLAPNFLHTLSQGSDSSYSAGILLFSPLIAVLAAAVAGLATQESQSLASRAADLGNRRFASSQIVGRTWLSATEQVEVSASRLNIKWQSFAMGVIPAPLIAALCPGALSFKAIVCAAIAAAQAAYYLSIAEYFLASAVEAVALKARASAVADTYANQSSRAGAILPFTSALAGLCAAASAAAVELLPLVHIVELQSLLSMVFPSGAALFAAAATVAKARCEVDSAAASLAVSTGLTPQGDQEEDPLQTVRTQIFITLQTTWIRITTRAKQWKNAVKRGDVWTKWRRWWQRFAGRYFVWYLQKTKTTTSRTGNSSEDSANNPSLWAGESVDNNDPLGTNDGNGGLSQSINSARRFQQQQLRQEIKQGRVQVDTQRFYSDL